MKAILRSGCLALAVMALAVPAHAGPFADQLAALERNDYDELLGTLMVALLSLFTGWNLNSMYFRSKWRRRRTNRMGQHGAKSGVWNQFGRVTQSAWQRSEPNMADPQHQLEAISKVSFEKRRLLNKAEYPILPVLERAIRELNQGHRVMAQTSLGELIQPRENTGNSAARKNAYASVNSKRLDFAVVDKSGLLALAIEYQGSGHYHQTTFMRDAVKREALRRADVRLYEIEKNWAPEEVERSVRAFLLETTQAN